MQTKFFGRNALGGVLCTLLTGLIFVVATSCDSGKGDDPENSSNSRNSSSSFQKPSEIVSPDVSISDTTFRWVSATRQDEVEIGVSVRLTAPGSDIKGFDSVLVKLNNKVLNTDKGKETYIFDFVRNGMGGEDYINVEEELGLGVCGDDVTLIVEVYAYAVSKKTPEARATKTLKKDANVGNCRSSSSTVPSSSSVFQIKSLDRVGTISLKDGEGVKLADATSGSDLTVSIKTSGGRETTLNAGSDYHMTDQFLTDVEYNNCGDRGFRYNQASDNYVGGSFNTEKFYPCLSADMESSFDCRNTFKLVKRKDSNATDWAQGWYLIYCIEEGSGANSSAKIEVWKTN